MRKLTPKQETYKKEVSRIRSTLSKLRKQGYDVSELAGQYSPVLPHERAETLKNMIAHLPSDFKVTQKAGYYEIKKPWSREYQSRLQKELRAIRDKGYIITEGKESYSIKKPPSRVTDKLLNELHSVTPKKLRNELKMKWVGFKPPKGTKLEYPGEKYTDPIPAEDFPFKAETPRKPTEPFMPPPTYEEPSGFMPEPTQIEEIASPDGSVDVVDTETGELIEQRKPEEPPIAEVIEVENPDGSLDYIDTDTGETVNNIPAPQVQPEEEPEEETYEEYSEEDTYDEEWEDYDLPFTETPQSRPSSPPPPIPDLTEYAVEFIQKIPERFGAEFGGSLKEALDYMISTAGEQAVANAFLDVVDDNPSLLEQLEDLANTYKAATAIFGSMIEKLDIPISLKEIMRDNVTSESMADIEDYGT